MPLEFETMCMADSPLYVAQFIRSRPAESMRSLILAVYECLRMHCALNEAELQIKARQIRYARF